MENRIEVEKEIRESSRHEHFVHFAISLIGVIVPVTLWAIYYGKIASPIWWGFFTVVMILVSVTSFLFGTIRIIATAKTMSHYRKVLTLYANIDEQTHIPQRSIVTTCLRPDMGRFGFQKINYFFWIDATELVFFPVRPEFMTSKAYHIVQSVRLNNVMVRSYSMIGKEYDDGVMAAQENYDAIAPLSFWKSKTQPLYRDTRATLIAYAIGEQTVYMAFDSGLYDKLKEQLPDKDKWVIEAKKRQEQEPITNPSPVQDNPKNDINEIPVPEPITNPVPDPITKPNPDLVQPVNDLPTQDSVDETPDKWKS